MPYLVLDLEMTGPEPGWHEIIQIGAALYSDDWQHLGNYESLVYPEDKETFTASAEKVHGISLDDLENAPMIYEMIEDFEKWAIGKLTGKAVHDYERQRMEVLRRVIICGQSVVNDINFLRFAYRDEKIDWPFPNTLIDLHTLSYFYFKIMEQNKQRVPDRRSLKAIAAHFGHEREAAEHNALEDALLTAACLKEIFERSSKLKLIP
jgi:DNA polymerase III subunit epsilon